jgi:phosphoglycolate phosphatase
VSTQDWNWIFDWSGTLVDDMALVICATNHVMRTYQKPEWERESFLKSFYLPYKNFYSEHIPGVEIEEIENHFRQGFAQSQEVVSVLPHAEDFLEFLKNRDHRMFVLTSMCAIAFSEQVDELKLNHYFENTYAGVLDKRDLIGEILKQNGLDPNKTIFVGDMTHDIETAHHGRVYSAGVLTGYNDRELLESVMPNLILENLAEFKTILTDETNWQSLMEVKA